MKIMNRVQIGKRIIDGSMRNRSIFKFQKRILNGTSKVGLKAVPKDLFFNTRKANSKEFKPHIMKTASKSVENYKNGEFIDGKCFDETGTEIVFLFGKT
jgi:protein TonB